MSAELQAVIADLRELHKQSTSGKWRQGMTSHHTVSRAIGREDYRVAEFRHANDASFCDAAHEFLPMLLDALASPQAAPELSTASRPEAWSDGDYLVCAKVNGASVEWEGDNAGVHFTTTAWANFCNSLRAARAAPGLTLPVKGGE